MVEAVCRMNGSHETGKRHCCNDLETAGAVMVGCLFSLCLERHISRRHEQDGFMG